MSQKRFPIQKQKERLKQVPHSQKSVVSVKQSHASKKEAARLTKKLHVLAGRADWARNRAKFHWVNAKEFEDLGMIQNALEERTKYERQIHRSNCYDREIKEVEHMIDRLSIVYTVGVQKGNNYAMKKVEQPPSDNQE